ncbi:MAG TPA: phosphoribosylanthranilate isomerase, partial [Enterococcus sp.]|nr:phosphoribosylanthranilate isomerase [Enterococcus sp.]
MTKVKICGLTQSLHVDASVAAGADYLGFVFAKSRRLTTPEAVQAITQHVPPNVAKVGVFVQPTFSEIKQVAKIAGLTHIQLHGRLTDSVQQALVVGAFQQLHLSVIQAFNGETAALQRELAQTPAHFVLLDAPAE